MVSNNSSTCYFVQLQIDTYLDGELSPAQRDDFQSHLHQCKACAQELHYAQSLHDLVLDLPQVDCDDSVLEPIHRLGGAAVAPALRRPGFWQSLQDLIATVPLGVRYAMPVMLLVILAAPALNRLLTDELDAPLVAVQEPAGQTPEYSAEEIQQALAELNLAIEYLNSVGQRTEAMIGERFLITPIQDSLDASFEVIRRVNDDPLQNDPI